jgi:hypothetical protein
MFFLTTLVDSALPCNPRLAHDLHNSIAKSTFCTIQKHTSKHNQQVFLPRSPSSYPFRTPLSFILSTPHSSTYLSITIKHCLHYHFLQLIDHHPVPVPSSPCFVLVPFILIAHNYHLFGLYSPRLASFYSLFLLTHAPSAHTSLNSHLIVQLRSASRAEAECLFRSPTISMNRILQYNAHSM